MVFFRVARLHPFVVIINYQDNYDTTYLTEPIIIILIHNINFF